VTAIYGSMESDKLQRAMSLETAEDELNRNGNSSMSLKAETLEDQEEMNQIVFTSPLTPHIQQHRQSHAIDDANTLSLHWDATEERKQEAKDTTVADETTVSSPPICSLSSGALMSPSSVMHALGRHSSKDVLSRTTTTVGSSTSTAIPPNKLANIAESQYTSSSPTQNSEKQLPDAVSMTTNASEISTYADGDSIDFLRIWIQREKQDRDSNEVRAVCRKLQTACMMRERWVYKDKHGHFPSCLVNDKDICLNINIVKGALPKKSNHTFAMKHGVFRVFKLHKKLKAASSSSMDADRSFGDVDDDDRFEYIQSDKALYKVHSFGEFMKDLRFIMELMTDGPARTFCYQRLQTIQAKFRLHVLLNENNETAESKRVPHRDFYNIRKVDNHIHHSACMTQKHLLRFIKSRLKHNSTDVVYKNNVTQKTYTLHQLFNELNLSSYDLSIDTLSMHGHRDSFHRFDRFNNKYNPIGQSSLRQIFLKVDNYCKGKYLADITNEVFHDLKDSKYQYSELRLSIYGKKKDEWDILAAWICDNNLHCPNSRWMIQIPRLYAVYKRQGIIGNFGEMLDNIFGALFEVTIDPSSHPKLHLFLSLVTGFDTVDDESIRENTRFESYPEPSQWDQNENPPYIVWSYYIYANLFILNQLREHRGLNAFSYRPHAGEAGDFDHVAAAFLLAQSINHGLTLKKVPVLQYLFYLKQIGLSMSPLSNNLLFIEYDRNPFQLFFQRGLNVTLSTDDPLIIHYSKDPLIEEYAIAAQVYKLSAIDMSEIARNSVLQSGFPVADKKHWIGTHFQRRGAAGNNMKQTNVPDIRILFRDELLAEEENWILGLPPPIFPAIRLKAHSKVKAKKYDRKKQMNFLVQHRTKVPFTLQRGNNNQSQISELTPHIDPIQSPDISIVDRGGGDRYDPLGYFPASKQAHTEILSGKRKHLQFDDRNIISEEEYKQRLECERDVISMAENNTYKAVKGLSLLAVGLFMGYMVAAIQLQRSKRMHKD